MRKFLTRYFIKYSIFIKIEKQRQRKTKPKATWERVFAQLQLLINVEPCEVEVGVLESRWIIVDKV